MKTREFGSDRSDALRQQLVDLPNHELDHKPHPSRRVLLAVGAVGVGVAVLFGAPTLLEQTPNEPKQQAQPAQPATAVPTVALANAYADIPSSEIQAIGVNSDFLWDATDPYYGYNSVPIVARVHIDSIDGGRTYSPISGQYTFPQTVGQMTIREVYKGSLEPGTQQNYARNGGIVSYDQYWNSLNPAQQEKILRLNNGQRPTGHKFVHEKFAGDVDLAVGKDYVVLLRPRSSDDEKFHEYFIDGYQFGLREVKGTGADTSVLNNETQQWESLGSMVKLDTP